MGRFPMEARPDPLVRHDGVALLAESAHYHTASCRDPRRAAGRVAHPALRYARDTPRVPLRGHPCREARGAALGAALRQGASPQGRETRVDLDVRRRSGVEGDDRGAPPRPWGESEWVAWVWRQAEGPLVADPEPTEAGQPVDARLVAEAKLDRLLESFLR
jgi:hypothetical protein